MDDRENTGTDANATRSFSMPKPLDFSAANAFNTSEKRKRRTVTKRLHSMSIERPSTKKLPKHLFISEVKKHVKEEYEVTPT